MNRLEPGDPGYPALLAAVPARPALDVRGTLTADDALAVAIVGARRATPYGVAVAERLAADLAARGVTIVSGLARGIDTAAHRGALAAGGRTLAVLGSGIDVVYPSENRALARAIERQGALLSQFAAGAPGLPGHFPARNRTIAGLALGVVVVEAAERSGALITAGFAGDLGREVFAVPGRITSAASAGAHRLIQDGAKLVTCWQDVVQELPEQWRRALRAATTTDGPAGPGPRGDEARMLDVLAPDEPQHIERLIARGGLDAGRAAAALVALELAGLARQLAGQRWVRSVPQAGRG
ncbi:MAG: DNA protecting protein DprA [Candidatus Rokubacteria bacterium RIFCSPHIGHO2_12_FULL_73_22]|nr:MAG: DNA protecting protein DprA [Candidatus Rokubacteria bacterium RIFCSPHIGHO2_02_FULL_73_26]OGL00727.1 MAG: DNA protecting protein DprA [Candidatus Rokubacteria bacterium RIFCSPHIGHO2_12_FULL_73_22]OGL09346.1 MAG: DNA protecting protein DprA [Candidatus Rokubacteria bacterium RIFCSPLOWO2_02_FULL_73_56]OGL29191.1 MAG: DNA protecting protein DprA [Candidatus Rokubacteria bacterium RIFCSPLOWO2_12_FULL_73_47]